MADQEPNASGNGADDGQPQVRFRRRGGGPQQHAPSLSCAGPSVTPAGRVLVTQPPDPGPISAGNDHTGASPQGVTRSRRGAARPHRQGRAARNASTAARWSLLPPVRAISSASLARACARSVPAECATARRIEP